MSNIDEEDDYLSASFIPDSSLDVRPGLNFSSSRKRKHEMEKKTEFLNQKNRRKPVRVLEMERRDEALKKEIEPDNKGFAMMQRMGYKPGTAIGKKEGKAQEPISITLKNDRSGLGKKEEEERLVKRKMELEIESHKNKVKNSQQLLVEYQEKVRKERTNKRVLSDLMKSQKACEQLDGQNGITEPKESWYWPKQKSIENEEDDEAAESEEDEERENFEEKLLILTSYLRSNFKYCLWCGVKFEDSDDLNRNCPGNTYDDHE